MALRLTAKQKKFAKLAVELGNWTEAYVQAYDVVAGSKRTTAQSDAKDLAKRPNVRREMVRLTELLQKRHDVNVDSLTDELNEAQQLAMNEAMPSAAIQATMGKAKLHGLLIDKQELKSPQGVHFSMVLDKPKEIIDVTPKEIEDNGSEQTEVD